MNLIFLLIGALNIGGFFEYQGQFLLESDSNSYLSHNLLNLTLKGRLESVYFRVDLVYTGYNGKTRFDLVDYLPVGLVYPDMSLPFYYRSGVRLRNGFVRVENGPLLFQLGRQQIGWGTGYAYNPTNVFQVKSVLDPTYELDGVDAIDINYVISPFWIVEGLIVPYLSLNASSRGGRLRGNLFGNTDFSIGYLYYGRDRLDPITLSLKREMTEIVTFDFSGEISGFGLHGEGAYFTQSKRLLGLLGMDYTLRDGVTSFMVEYLRNGEGKKQAPYTLSDWLSYLTGMTLSLGRDEIFIDLQRIVGFHTAHISLITNPWDMSGLAVFRLDYSINDNVSLVISPFISFGRKGKEYSTLPDGIFFRVRYSF